MGGGMLLTSDRWKPRMLLNISQTTGQPLKTKNCLAWNINSAEPEKPCSDQWLWHQVALQLWANVILSPGPFQWFFPAPLNPTGLKKVLLDNWHLYCWDQVTGTVQAKTSSLTDSRSGPHPVLSLTSSFTHCRQTILRPSHIGQFGKTQPRHKWAAAKQCHTVLPISSDFHN